MRPTLYRVADVMTRDVMTLTEENDLGLTDAIFGYANFRHLPVVRAGRLVGLVTQRDLLRCMAQHGLAPAKTLRAGDVMTRGLHTVTATTPLREATHLFSIHKIGCLPVVGPDGTLEGIVTEADLARFTTQLLNDFDELALVVNRPPVHRRRRPTGETKQVR